MHSSTSCTVSHAGLLELVARDRLEVEVAPVPDAVAVGGEHLVHLLADLVAAAARAGTDRRLERAVGAELADRADPSATIPPARPRQPAWSIATAAPLFAPGCARPARAIGRQSAVSTIGATPRRRVAWPSASGSSMSLSGSGATNSSSGVRDHPHDRSVDLPDMSRPDPDELLQPGAVAPHGVGTVVG